MGQTSTFTYNTLGQPASVTTPARGPAPAETISYGYGANGVWYMPKNDPDGLTLLPASDTDDQGRTVSYLLNDVGRSRTF